MVCATVWMKWPNSRAGFACGIRLIWHMARLKCTLLLLARQWRFFVGLSVEETADFYPRGVLEQVFEGFAGALEYLGGTFDSADSDVLPGTCRAFAQCSGGANGVKRH